MDPEHGWRVWVEEPPQHQIMILIVVNSIIILSVVNDIMIISVLLNIIMIIVINGMVSLSQSSLS